MEGLPSEMVNKILGLVPNPRDRLAWSMTTRGLRREIPGLEPVLEIREGQVVPWDDFAPSAYRRIRGSGELSVPTINDAILEVMSRRLRGDFLVRGHVVDAVSSLFKCLLARSLLYPQSTFRINGEGEAYVIWKDNTLFLSVSPEVIASNLKDLVFLASRLPIYYLILGSRVYSPEDSQMYPPPSVLQSSLENNLWTFVKSIKGLLNVTFATPHQFPLPDTVLSLTVPSVYIGGYPFPSSYQRVTDLSIYNYDGTIPFDPANPTPQNATDFARNVFRILQELPSVRRLTFIVPSEALPLVSSYIEPIDSLLTRLTIVTRDKESYDAEILGPLYDQRNNGEAS